MNNLNNTIFLARASYKNKVKMNAVVQWERYGGPTRGLSGGGKNN